MNIIMASELVTIPTVASLVVKPLKVSRSLRNFDNVVSVGDTVTLINSKENISVLAKVISQNENWVTDFELI